MYARSWGPSLLLSLLLTGCPGSSNTGSAPPEPGTRATQSALPGAAPSSMGQVMDAPDTAQGRENLASWARDDSISPELRYTALRRLEELGADQTVHVAGELIQDEAPMLRQNAVAVLVRLNTPRAREAIEAGGSDAQALAAVLRGGSK